MHWILSPDEFKIIFLFMRNEKPRTVHHRGAPAEGVEKEEMNQYRHSHKCHKEVQVDLWKYLEEIIFKMNLNSVKPNDRIKVSKCRILIKNESNYYIEMLMSKVQFQSVSSFHRDEASFWCSFIFLYYDVTGYIHPPCGGPSTSQAVGPA